MKPAKFLRLLRAELDKQPAAVTSFATINVVTGSLGDPAPMLVFPVRPDKPTTIDFPKYGYRLVKAEPAVDPADALEGWATPR